MQTPENMIKFIKRRSLIKLKDNSPIFRLCNGVRIKNVKINLTESEKKLVLLIRNTIDHFHLNSTARIAGGWVRDKLLGLNSDDIDINLDNLMGIDFVKKIENFSNLAEAKKLDLVKNKFGIGCIKSNPEKSKNLETATFCVFGISVDVNNLRTEIYGNESRVPTIV
ncbi:hypothetical protein MHBO_003061 [Bonamia ostreae]|uniref:Poly A polymerase head domain-containing protein n=1 Tax=Bonamia ostreae TaxID=126728 RepID=A0ABV2APC7_9EUKA